MRSLIPNEEHFAGVVRRDWERITAVLIGEPSLERVLLFGSRAKGTYERGSDIDLACYGSSLDITKMNRLRARIDELPTAYTVDLIRFESIENPDLSTHIERVGIPILER